MTTARDLLNDINAGKFKPAYYFYGDEDFRKIEAEKFLVRQFLPDLQISTNYRKIDGRRTNTADLLAQLSNLPMLGQREVISVSDFQHYRPNDVERVFKLLSPPDPNRVVIFSSPSARMPDKRGKFFKSITEAVTSIEFKPLTADEATSFVSARLQKEGIKLEPAALRLFVDSIGGNKGALENEILKLINYTNGPATVTEEQIRNLVSSYATADLFKIADTVAHGNTAQSLQDLRTLLADGNSPDSILVFLHRHFLSLYMAKHKRPNIQPPWLARQFAEQAKQFESEQLEQVLLQLADCWSDLRQGIYKPDTRMEVLFVSLTQRSK